MGYLSVLREVDDLLNPDKIKVALVVRQRDHRP